MTRANHINDQLNQGSVGTIYFDAACGLCTAAAKRTQRVFGPRGFAVVPLQSDEARDVLGVDPAAIPGEIKLRTRDGRVIGGADALVELSRHVWWMFPMRMIAKLPLGLRLMRRAYRWVARHRHAVSVTCRLDPGDKDQDLFFSQQISLDTEITEIITPNSSALREREIRPEKLKKGDRMYTVYSYIAYLLISVLLTVWVARTLHKNGRVFLIDAFHGSEARADSVNHLLVVGFYLINIGYVTLALKYGDKPDSLQSAIEFLSTKVGFVLVVLGGMHFFNMFNFDKMRRKALPKAVTVPACGEVTK